MKCSANQAIGNAFHWLKTPQKRWIFIPGWMKSSAHWNTNAKVDVFCSQRTYNSLLFVGNHEHTILELNLETSGSQKYFFFDE